MSTQITWTQAFFKTAGVALKLVGVALKLAGTVISILLAIGADEDKPVCGPGVARQRREDGCITPDQFYRAVKKRR